MAYTNFSEFERYIERFGTLYYGTFNELAGTLAINTTAWQADIDSAFDRINNMLDSIPRIPIIPIGTSVRTGSYNPYLVEWNTVDAIYYRLLARHVTEYGMEGLPDWIKGFGSRSMWIYDAFITEKIVFDTDTSFRGIGYPVKGTTLAGFGTLFSNWDTGFYRASDFPKTFHIKISGTTAGNDIGKAKFQISEDDGFSYDTTEYDTGTGWIDVKDGLLIRWLPYGTGNQCEIGDYWKITCKPMNIRPVGYRTTAKTFGRG